MVILRLITGVSPPCPCPCPLTFACPDAPRGHCLLHSSSPKPRGPPRTTRRDVQAWRQLKTRETRRSFELDPPGSPQPGRELAGTAQGDEACPEVVDAVTDARRAPLQVQALQVQALQALQVQELQVAAGDVGTWGRTQRRASAACL